MRKLLMVVAIVTIFSPMTSLSQQPEIIEAPKLMVGDRWERSNGRVYEVVGEEEGLYVVRRTRGSQITEELWDKATLSLVKWREPSKSKELKSPSAKPQPQHLNFPLSVGKKWDTTFLYIPVFAYFQRWYKVERWEEVKVPAGTFKALRIRSEGRRLDTGYQFTEIYWYSPEVRGLIKATSDVANREAREPMEFELLSFRPGNTQ